MTQADFTVANQTFPNTRAEINTSLQALATNSAGNSAPSTTFANQWWFDSDDNKLYMRNKDNDAWVEILTIGATSDKVESIGSGGGLTITTADNTDTLTLTSTDVDANSGPNLRLYRNSSSPADSDVFGQIDFEGKNSAAEDFVATQIKVNTGDVTDGTEDAQIEFDVMTGGTLREYMRMAAGSNPAVIINQDSRDINFQVLSDDNANMLFVDADNNSVHIGSSTVETSDVFAVYNDGTSTPVRIANTNANSVAPSLIFQKNSSSPADDDELGLLNFLGQDSAGNANVFAQIVTVATDITNGTEDGQITLGTVANGTYAINMRIGSNILIGTTDNSPAESSSATGMRLGTNGGTQIATSGMEVMRLNRNSDDGAILVFSQAGSAEGNISVSGTTISYAGFTGTHWSRLADNSKPTILRGTIMDSIDEMCDWYQAVVDVPEVLWTADDNLMEGANVGDVKEEAYQFKQSISLGDKSVGDSITFTKDETEYTGTIVKEGDVKHNKCKVSDTADSKKVYGVFSNWDDADDGLDSDVNDMNIAQVGTFIIRVNADEVVQAGDLLVSNGDGTAKKQDDDIIRSKTVAKVNSNIKIETYADDSYTVPCTLHC